MKHLQRRYRIHCSHPKGSWVVYMNRADEAAALVGAHWTFIAKFGYAPTSLCSTPYRCL